MGLGLRVYEFRSLGMRGGIGRSSTAPNPTAIAGASAEADAGIRITSDTYGFRAL